MVKFNFISKDDLFIVSSLSLLYVAPIISTGIPYIDDMGRSIWGYSGWEDNGRPVAMIIMRFISLGIPLQNIHPIPQLLGALIVGISGLIFFKIVGHTQKKVAIYCCALSFLINPFFLENLSYQYDSLPMSLSIFTLVVPFIFLKDFQGISKELIIWNLVVSCSIITSLSLYQASINLFFIFHLIYFIAKVIKLENKNEIIHLMLIFVYSSVNFLISFLIYKIFIADRLVEGDYSTKHSQVLYSVNFFTEFIENCLSYFTYILSNLNGISNFIFYPLLLSSIIVSILASINFIKMIGMTRTTFPYIIFFVSIPLIVFFLSFGLLAFLKVPLFTPRVLIGFSGFVFLGMYSGSILFDKVNYLSVLLVIPVFSCFILNISYVNALKFQDMYDKGMYETISRDIISLGFKKNDFIAFVGKQNMAEEAKLASSKFTIIESLVPKYVYDNWYWGYLKLRRYGIYPGILSDAEYSKLTSNFTCGEKVVISSYSIICKSKNNNDLSNQVFIVSLH